MDGLVSLLWSLIKRKREGERKENMLLIREAGEGLTATQSIEWRRRRVDFSGVKKRMRERQREEGGEQGDGPLRSLYCGCRPPLPGNGAELRCQVAR